MSRLLEVADLCSRTVSVPANRLRKTRKKKSSAVPYFRSGHMSVICARLGSKGKVGVQRGRKTAGCPSFLPSAAGRGESPRSAERNSSLDFKRKTSRPLGANTPAAVRVPRSVGAEKGAAPLRANRLCGSCTPVSRCRIEKKRFLTEKICGNPLGLIAHPIYICYNKQ